MRRRRRGRALHERVGEVPVVVCSWAFRQAGGSWADKAGNTLADPARSMTLKEKDPIDPEARHRNTFIIFFSISLDLVSFLLD